MRKILAMLVLPAVFSIGTVISTEKDVEFSQDQLYSLSGNPLGNYYTVVPTHPTVVSKTPTFKDGSLQEIAGYLEAEKPVEIAELHVNDQGIPVFLLKNKQFVAADKQIIIEDSLQSQEIVQEEGWLQKGFKVFAAPYQAGVKEVKSDLKAYQKVTITKKASTARDVYSYIDGKGWISNQFISPKDNRMDQVQDLLTEKYQKDNLGIYVYDLTTQTEAGINADKEMYSASVTKLPYLYYAQEQINKGKFKTDQKFKYIDQVNDFSGSYDNEGSGSLPKEADNQEYSLDELMSKVAKESDNSAHNILAYYTSNQSDKDFQKQIDAIAGKNWDVESRMVTPRMVGNVLTAIYDQNSPLIDLMSETNFDQERISKNIDVKVAHKIGDAYDYKHDAAIIYGARPFVLVVFTDQASYDTISQIADDLYGVLK